MKRPPKVADASISPQFKLNRRMYKLVKSLKEGASLEVSRGGEIVFVACNSRPSSLFFLPIDYPTTI